METPHRNTMENPILVHNTGPVATLDHGGSGEPLRGTEMVDSDELLLEPGTEILFSNGMVTGIESSGTLISEWANSGSARIVDAEGSAVIPAFVDSHTHLVWSGDRSDEITMRARGLDYSQISRMGGGIRRTVSATRNATKEGLSELFLNRLEMAKSLGTGRMRPSPDMA